MAVISLLYILLGLVIRGFLIASMKARYPLSMGNRKDWEGLDYIMLDLLPLLAWPGMLISEFSYWGLDMFHHGWRWK
jgi:hypothetical protein